MKLAFDLDGTLYDTLDHAFKLDSEIRRNFGYEDITREFYRQAFQSKDWEKLYADLGIRQEDIAKVISEWERIFDELEPPQMIPGAMEALKKAELALGHDNIYIITNAPKEGVVKRFQRDGLTHYLDRVDHPYKGKANELHKLATRNDSLPFIYVGDLVSDGEECREARNMGASNISFYGIVHPYAMSTEEAMRNFISGHVEFAQVLNNLDEVHRIWTQK